ncbi:hypothetical protein FCN77_24785 [Arthrobacter sp. 24S4-2]|uniref:hypothetical protein n=1 Tax=Arthrobacter sp. 24S4-2 TaxID=2575374 RepID=UPI0010C78E59|nr:hypothetical protein [Arthrobacter sp. 24S4-2]QCP00331.1 hypothetical protein FCN77_24785 [Arthrobacter sp. 24S4-2]
MNHQTRTVLGTRTSVASRHGAASTTHYDHSEHRLKIMVRIEADLEAASMEVHGVVTGASLRALYVIARRTTSLLHGKDLTIDLSRARATDTVLEQLHECARLSRLSSGVDSSEVPCRVKIVDPGFIHKVKEYA